MPYSIEKDYYIWRYLTQNSTTSSQAKLIIRDVKHLNDKLRKAYKKKTGLRAKAYKPKNPQPKRATTKAQRLAWINKKKGISFRSYHKKAIDALQKNNEILAVAYLQKAKSLAMEQYEVDQATFWLYLITKKKSYLRKLLRSWDVNLYTLMARDRMHIKYPKTITPKLPKRDIKSYNQQNPIHWAYIKNKIFHPKTDLISFANNYRAEESVGVYTYIRTNASHKKEIYYPMPYRNIMSRYPKQRQALLYAIARQESRFIPASISRSFALGMMQIMPFLIEHIAKQRGEKIDFDDMFNPKVAIVYANHHLNYLMKYLYNPLLVAYAYNGGIGFTKRMITRSDYFKKGRYEPYLSMEKIANVEAREYGKRVLVNFVIYLNKLDIPARVTPIVEQLTDPSKCDKFRK
jgi:soluble lytic murein transglycosylase